jgi:hypothetical protein
MAKSIFLFALVARCRIHSQPYTVLTPKPLAVATKPKSGSASADVQTDRSNSAVRSIGKEKRFDSLKVQKASTNEEYVPDAKHQGIVGKASVVV